jgi:hypothetical protein
MATLVLDKPLVTAEPVVDVDPRLPVGRYRAELVVIDEAGVSSLPATLDLEISEGGSLPTRPVSPDAPVIGTVVTPVVNPDITRPLPIRPGRPRRRGGG